VGGIVGRREKERSKGQNGGDGRVGSGWKIRKEQGAD